MFVFVCLFLEREASQYEIKSFILVPKSLRRKQNLQQVQQGTR